MAEKNGAHSVMGMQERELLAADEQLNAAKNQAEAARNNAHGAAWDAYQAAIEPLTVARDEIINAVQAGYHTAVGPHAIIYRAAVKAADEECSEAYLVALREYKEGIEATHNQHPFLIRHMTEAPS